MASLAKLKIDQAVWPDARGLLKYAAELILIGLVYFVLAKFGLILASIHPSATPIWPPTGFALAVMLCRGFRFWPAIFVAATLANATTEIADATPLSTWLAAPAIATGNTLEALVGGYLLRIWAGGPAAFESPSGVAKFALLCLAPGTMISAIIGVATLVLAGHAAPASFAPVWFTWWLGDVAGAIVVTPVLVLWARSRYRVFNLDSFLESSLALAIAIAVGLLAFSPLIEQTVTRSALSFLAVLPLLLAALRCGPRDTATVAFILSCFAVWGTLAGGGPLAAPTLNDSFLLLIMFMITITVPSLALSADVAARKRVETRQRQQTQDMRAMFSQAIVGIAQLDIQGRFTVANQRFCEIIQRPSSELLMQHVQDVLDPDDPSHFAVLLDHAMHTGEGFVTESPYGLADGSRVWVRNSVSAITGPDGAVRRILIVAEDVTVRRRAEENLRRAHDDLEQMVHERTAALQESNSVLHTEIEQRKRVETALKLDIAERRKAQEALMESERRLRLFIQGVTDYAIFMLDPDGYIANWNMGAQRIHQYSVNEIVGQHFSRFYTEEEQRRGEPARALQVAAYEGKYVAEGWRVRRDESLFWASIVIEAIRDEAGTLVGYAKVTRDITERREAQIALARAQEQLAQSQKMEALGQLTGSIAHDFNNLLMIVSGYAQLLRRRLSDPKLLQAVDAVHSAASRGESLTRQLLAFSRRQPLTPVVIDVKERIESVREMLVGSLRGNVELKYDMPEGLWPIEVDIAELELALVNIVVNARDAMPGGGAITLSARNVSLKKSDGVDHLEGDFVALAISDTGVGIAPDVMSRIFEPFYTTKPLGKGTGLGLAQVYGFSHQSGGTVVANSAVGSGTTITLYLPRSHGEVAKIADAPSVQPGVLGEGTVLVVEDNPEVAQVTVSMVEQLGYQAIRAENASDALYQLQRTKKPVDLVLSDIVMPGSMNGMALAQEIGNRYPQIPVLLTSGYSDMVQAAGSRFVILRKPFQLPMLEKSIRELLEHFRNRTGGQVVRFPQGRG